jgi:hypothetical protein
MMSGQLMTATVPAIAALPASIHTNRLCFMTTSPVGDASLGTAPEAHFRVGAGQAYPPLK